MQLNKDTKEDTKEGTENAGIIIRVKAVPGASRDQIAGRLGDRLKVRISAPPEGGKANKSICTLLAKQLGIKPAMVTIVSGHTNAEKRFCILGTDEIAIEALFAG